MNATMEINFKEIKVEINTKMEIIGDKFHFKFNKMKNQELQEERSRNNDYLSSTSCSILYQS